jgi:hypothetical protein
VLGPVQVEILQLLHDAEAGVPVEDLLKQWTYKQCGKKSIASLQQLGLIRISKNIAYFVRFPEALEPKANIKGYTPEQLKELDDLSRRNLLLLYKDELAKYQDGTVPAEAIPHGVRRSLQHLGVIKWKILELTDLGRRLLGEIMSRTTPPMQSGVDY